MKNVKGLTTIASAVILTASLVACSTQTTGQASTETPQPKASAEISQPIAGTETPQVKTNADPAQPKINVIAEQKVLATVWSQTAGEAKALYYQAYNLGKLKLDAALAKGTSKKASVILDLDETVLDNSPFDAVEISTGKGHPYKWDEWVDKAEAKGLPGAVEFLKYADSKGVDIYYISDRSATQTDATVKNLKFIGAPQAMKEHVLLKEKGENGKEGRFNKVGETHETVLFFGDNLKDFYGFFGKS